MSQVSHRRTVGGLSDAVGVGVMVAVAVLVAMLVGLLVSLEDDSAQGDVSDQVIIEGDEVRVEQLENADRVVVRDATGIEVLGPGDSYEVLGVGEVVVMVDGEEVMSRSVMGSGAGSADKG